MIPAYDDQQKTGLNGLFSRLNRPILERLAHYLARRRDPSYRYRRVAEVFVAGEAILAFGIVMSALGLGTDRDSLTIALFAVIEAALVFLHWQFTKGREEIALHATVWVCTVMLSAASWTGEGLRDGAIAGYGVLLVFAAFFGSRRNYVVMASFMLLNITGMGFARSFELVHFRMDYGLTDAINMALCYAVLGYCVDALSQDLRTMIDRYRDENEKVRQSEAEILRMVHHDLLTGLPNRLIAQRDFEAFLNRPDGSAAVFFIDLDHFKAVNDTLGHAAGDELLKAITHRLSAAVGEKATLCRVGGDEFLIVTSRSDRKSVLRLAERIRVLAGEPLEMGGRTIMPTFSIGIARHPDDGDDFETLSRKADIALYSAKASGRNMFRIYDDTMNSQSLAHIYLSSRLRDAIANGEMQVYYQPKISLKTGQVEGAEALLRWFPAGADPVSPDDFIPMAENSGQIDELGRWVLQQACAQCRAWQLDRFPGMKISVNVSAAQFRRGGLAKAVEAALKESGLDPACLELELTESILLHEEFDIGGQIGRIRAMGVTFSIDDFGKGYSNLGYLGKLDIGTLKIDRHFIAHMMNTERDKALVGAIFAIAKALNLKTVAEGVENEESIKALKAFGCSTGQGFYWSRPVEPAAFEAYAATIRGRARRA